MARIPLLKELTTDPVVTTTFAEIEAAFGKVPNLFQAYAHHPPLLKANWEKVKAVMMGDNLRRVVKEAIAVLVSKDNSCSYCVAAHTAVLQSLGVNKERIAAIEQDLDAHDFSHKEQLLIALAREANRNPLGIDDETFRAIRDAGASDVEIVEALGIMEVFTAFNKFLDSLQVEIDF